jgi:hypothetical protein
MVKKESGDTDIENRCAQIADKVNPYREALEDGCFAAGNPRRNCQEINH